MKKIWLDDINPPPDKSWTWVKRTTVVKMMIAAGIVSEISLDNDLGPNQEEGYKVLDWLEETLSGSWGLKMRGKIPKIHIHSMNSEAVRRMKIVAARIEKLRPKRMFEDK